MSDAAVVVDGDTTFTCPRDRPLLDAALDAGVPMAHSCRGGACGTCKAQVIEGAVDHGWALTFAISDAEKAQGYCLCCQARPLSDRIALRMVIPLRSDAPPAIAPVEFQAQVVAAQAASPSVLRLVLALPPDLRFAFHPGQNVEVQVPGLALPRPYSIAHAPDADGLADGQLEFLVARHPHGRASGWLHERQPGDTLTLKGPYGEFMVPPGDGAVLMLAGGTGLAPLLSLAEAALRKDAEVELILSVRSRREAIGLDRLAALARRHPRFRHAVTLTRETAPGFRTGRIPALLEGRDLSGARACIAGAPEFVEACVAACRGRGMAGERIAVDSFVTDAPV